MNPLNRTACNIEERGWFTSPLEPVSKKASTTHQAEKKTRTFSLNRAIKAVALGILGVTQSMRFSVQGVVQGSQVALPALGLHLWSHIPTVSAQPSPTAPLGPQGDEFQVNTNTTNDQRSPSPSFAKITEKTENFTLFSGSTIQYVVVEAEKCVCSD